MSNNLNVAQATNDASTGSLTWLNAGSPDNLRPSWSNSDGVAMLRPNGVSANLSSYNTPTAGQTVTMAAGESRCLINPAGTLATLTVVLPPNPVDGQICHVASTKIVTTLTVNAGTGGATIVGAPAALAVGIGFSMIYRLTGTSWYPT